MSLVEIALKLIIAFTPYSVEDEALRQVAPNDLSPNDAHEHMQTARMAAWISSDKLDEHGVAKPIKHQLPLEIARHESRFTSNVVSREPWWSCNSGHCFSCGVMTPKVVDWACPKRSLLAQYTDGIEHLMYWVKTYQGNIWAGLTAYAGGSGLVKTCRKGKSGHKQGQRPDLDACDIAAVFIAGAHRIDP